MTKAGLAAFEAREEQRTGGVMSAKREETRDRRLATLVECCAKRTPIAPMRREKP